METMAATEFKAKCLSLMDTVDNDGIVITKRGKPVAKLVPYDPGFAQFIGCMKGQIKILDDDLSTGVVWDATRQP